jgi:hypothetical protein
MRALAVALLLLASASLARAERCRLRGAPFLETKTGARTLDLRRGEEGAVFVAAPAWFGSRAVVLSDSGVAGRVPFTGCAATLRWSRVEPLLEHTNTPAPNGKIAVYSNAVVFGPHHGKWIGFDRIEQLVTPLDEGRTSIVVRDARPSAELGAVDRGDRAELGMMRLAAAVTIAGETRTTPEELDAAFRYTVREGDDFIGWLTSFFNVPYLFGSAGKGARAQAERYYGADCADVLVAALRRAGASLEYTSVAGLIDEMPRVGSVVTITPCTTTVTTGCGASALRFGTDVRRGDLLALDYVDADELPRPWDHIVAVLEDRGPDGRPDGVLGPDDLMIDSGDRRGVKVAPLSDQGNVRIQVLRPPSATHAIHNR